MSHMGPVHQDSPACGDLPLLVAGLTPKLFMHVDSFHLSTRNPMVGIPVCHLNFSDEGIRHWLLLDSPGDQDSVWRLKVQFNSRELA